MQKAAWVCMLYMHCTYAAPSDADFCRNGLFPSEQDKLSLGVIQGRPAEQVHFFDDLDGCPAERAQCMRPAYLVPGDDVVVGKTTADWACVWYQGRKHESVSWVPKKNVALRPAAPVHPVRDWVGVWTSGPDQIRISSSGPAGALRILSRLRWEGGRTSRGEPIAHFGGMTGSLNVEGARASAVQDDCQLRLTRIGSYLVADDNGSCGGMNVRHTGMYRRSSK